ncbi:MAG: tRNA dihydrouridine synthase DusB [Pseudomonadota bacterium]
MQIGPYQLKGQLILAPMAGVTDLPFRLLCRKLGAAMAVSEMITSQSQLWLHKKTQTRLVHKGESTPISVQIAGTDPKEMALAAQFNVTHGAQIIDINMGCPAKKVCKVQAGSALLKNEPLVREILTAVVNAVDVPVTLKIRTGWDKQNKNALNIADIAQCAGIKALAIHGRTRQCGYSGEAEYALIKQVKQQSDIPIIANGDISSIEKAQFVLQYTLADALMIGREAQRNPWIFREVNHFLDKGEKLLPPNRKEIAKALFELLTGIYQLYGQKHGVRIARKHIRAMIYPMSGGDNLWQQINQISNASLQYKMVKEFFS